MTFVAVLYSDTHPLILVDSLISRPASAAGGIATPLLDTLDTRGGLGYQPVGLGRKFWLLPDRSLFLYSGTVGSAQKLFDYLCTLLSPTQPYGREIHQDAREFRARRTDKAFSFLVVTPNGEDVELHHDGEVHHDEIPTYGYVLAIGSGAKEGLEILRRRPGVEPDSSDAVIGNALNAAARLTQDYQDDWGTGSKMSAASCGGYFEVVPPTMYERSYEYLYRGTAQLFLRCDIQGIRLSRFIAAHQKDEETVIVAGSDLAIPIGDLGFSVDPASLREYKIRADQKDSVNSVSFDGHLSFGHIAFLIIYVEGLPDCGLAHHAFRTLSVSSRGGDPIALLQENDDPWRVDATGSRVSIGHVLFEIMAMKPADSPLRQITDRVRKHMVCGRCASDGVS
ncbi:hypothetical protein [Massilia phyllosphaerae]|uniref:hypothetical protein n=1 Tax=Massilia phyllosphaerae TaxID=3106034 RepID=UPI002B1CD85D|nr:hypothetical protein [Massilia sp. SGZ-792]